MNALRDRFGALSAYQSVATIGAPPETLMMTGLQAALRFLTEAETAIAAADRPRKARALYSANRIVEFMLGLTGIQSGRFSERLARLYRFALSAILNANANDDAEAVAAARAVIEEIATQWRRLFPETVS
jgi:flagellar biosynthetic protein FliS